MLRTLLSLAALASASGVALVCFERATGLPANTDGWPKSPPPDSFACVYSSPDTVRAPPRAKDL